MLRRFADSWAADVLLALVLGGLGVVDTFAQLAAVAGDAPEQSALAPVLLVAAALAVRRMFPFQVLLAVLAVILVPAITWQVNLIYWGEFVPWLLVLYTAGRHLPVRLASWGLGLSLLAMLLLGLDYPMLGGPGNFLWNGITMAIAWGFGVGLRSRAALRQEYARLDHERHEAEQRAVAGERTRIARELHDVIAHGIGVIVLQAGGARLGFDSDPEGAREALRRIESTGRDSLTELRLLMEVLRQDEVTTEGIDPQPTLQRLTELVAETRANGLPVTLQVSPAAVELPLGLQLSVYRIVQEALTNVVKHSGTVPTTVAIDCNGSLVVEVCNAAGPGALVPAPSGGHGLVGLAERVSVLGGVLRTGPGRDGGFRLLADIPLPRATT